MSRIGTFLVQSACILAVTVIAYKTCMPDFSDTNKIERVKPLVRSDYYKLADQSNK